MPLFLSYSDSGGAHTFPLERASVSIGRAQDQDIVLSEPCVSRRHARLLINGEACAVEDLKSTHGTFLNGSRIQHALLKPGDMLQFGSLHGPGLHLKSKHGPATQDTTSPIGKLVSTMISTEPRSSAPRAMREMERLNWLLRAARLLNEGNAIEDILDALLRLTLELTRLDRGFVFLESNHELQLALGMNAEGARLKEDSTLSRKAIDRAIASQAKFSVSDTFADTQAGEWPSVLQHRIRSIYCIPLRKPVWKNESGALLGLLYLDSQRTPAELNEVDEQLLGTLAGEAAALVHNALLAEAEFKARQAREELALAAAIHHGLMSKALPSLPYAALQATSIPCLAIGGDFYDAIALEDCLCTMIADVSGKGVAAAIVAATLQGIVHSQLLMGRALAEIAALANQFLCAHDVGKYATMIVLKLFPDGRAEYINCGHIPPFCVLGEQVRRLEESNLVVGLIPGAQYHSGSCILRPDERVLLVTDGLTEAENTAGEAFGESGITALAQFEQLSEILNRIQKFQAPNPPQDDCTVVAVQYKSPRHA